MSGLHYQMCEVDEKAHLTDARDKFIKEPCQGCTSSVQPPLVECPGRTSLGRRRDAASRDGGSMSRRLKKKAGTGVTTEKHRFRS